MNELDGEDWATVRTLHEADEGRRLSARRLRDAELRREELLGARGDQPRLQDVPQAEPDAMPAVATEATPDSESPVPERQECPLTPRTRPPQAEAPPTTKSAGALLSPASSESPGIHTSYPMTIGKKALQPHDASQESLEDYAAKLSKY